MDVEQEVVTNNNIESDGTKCIEMKPDDDGKPEVITIDMSNDSSGDSTEDVAATMDKPIKVVDVEVRNDKEDAQKTNDESKSVEPKQSEEEVTNGSSEALDDLKPPSPCDIENMTVVDEDVDEPSDVEAETSTEKIDSEKEQTQDSKTNDREKGKEPLKEIKAKKSNGSSTTADDVTILKQVTISKRGTKRKPDEEEDKSSKRREKRSESKSKDTNDQKEKSSRLPDKKEESRKSKEETKDKDKEVKKLPLLDKYWKAVKDDPSDFTGWTYLLQYVDQANDVKSASEVYNDFLSRYPYCYGYWRKYADYLKRNGEKERCEEIFEKGVSAIPLSVDLWIHYLNYSKTTYAGDEAKVRALFEKAIKSCGLEFRSDRLWDLYVKWEAEENRLENVTNVFDRWLVVPTQGYNAVMEKFKDHVKKHSPNKILDVEEFFLLRNDVVSDLKSKDMEQVESKLSDDAPPGEETPERLEKMNEEETKALKDKIIQSRKERHKSTQKEATTRWTFEENIKRPYFHVKPLEQCQLNNWKEYLEFEIKEGNQERIIMLFERCLIACALYEEFWIKFAEFLQSLENVDVDKVRDVFVRACTIHHSKKLNVHLKWAAFEEAYGNVEKAIEIIENLEKSFPNLLALILQRINLERRRKNYDTVCKLFQEYIDKSDNLEISSSLAIKYSRFCRKFLDDTEKGIDILKNAIKKNEGDLRLKLQLIDALVQQTPTDVDAVNKIFDDLLAKEDNLENKLLHSQRKLEFLEDFSDSYRLIQKAHEVHDTCLKEMLLKKKADDAKKLEAAKKAAIEGINHPPSTPAATSGSGFYQSTQPPPNYQSFGPGQGYGPQFQQQNVYQGDPNYGYQNWQQFGPYGQAWPGPNPPPGGPAGGYNYMY